MVVCNGQGVDGDHCCYVDGIRCPHLVENTAGRRYACGLMLRHGSWDLVVSDPDYKPIGDHWESIGQGFDYCATFDPARCCRKDG